MQVGTAHDGDDDYNYINNLKLHIGMAHDDDYSDISNIKLTADFYTCIQVDA